MASSNLPAFRLSKRQRRLVAVAGLCALLQAVAADAVSGGSSPEAILRYDAAKEPTRVIRIKRLRPADPESREIMLADRRFSVAGNSFAPS